jgi:hypothetical protein
MHRNNFVQQNSQIYFLPGIIIKLLLPCGMYKIYFKFEAIV